MKGNWIRSEEIRSWKNYRQRRITCIYRLSKVLLRRLNLEVKFALVWWERASENGDILVSETGFATFGSTGRYIGNFMSIPGRSSVQSSLRIWVEELCYSSSTVQSTVCSGVIDRWSSRRYRQMVGWSRYVCICDSGDDHQRKKPEEDGRIQSRQRVASRSSVSQQRQPSRREQFDHWLLTGFN